MEENQIYKKYGLQGIVARPFRFGFCKKYGFIIWLFLVYRIFSKVELSLQEESPTSLVAFSSYQQQVLFIGLA
ncbi:MAG: hypothetical protein R6V72_21495 [Cyclobacterium sp.]|uniref:hypothetical protein n=1 Tax=unclassified Cyclobacterium TaxID=2615055 RepID=UPI001969C2BA|nr:hypothetical protein [Cyclobacterium sp. SYSU L10401]